MLRCIYCDKTEKEVKFTKSEHVLPRLLGAFDEDPTLVGLVCDTCNSEVLNPLETKFKEDTEEGIIYQMFNFENNYQIRILGDHVKTKFAMGLGDEFFDHIFPLLRINEEKIQMVFAPQIKIKRH